MITMGQNGIFTTLNTQLLIIFFINLIIFYIFFNLCLKDKTYQSWTYRMRIFTRLNAFICSCLTVFYFSKIHLEIIKNYYKIGKLKISKVERLPK